MLQSIFNLSPVKNEPYLTQIFAYVLNADREFAKSFSKKFFSRDKDVQEVLSEVDHGPEKPDLVFVYADGYRLALENKINALFTPAQIQRYKKIYPEVFLIYRSLSDPKEARFADDSFSWYKFSFFLTNYISKVNETYCKDKLFILKNFLSYLKGQNMSYSKISWEILGGMNSLRDLFLMIEESFSTLKSEGKITKYECKSGSQSYYYWNLVTSSNESVNVGFFYNIQTVCCFFDSITDKIPAKESLGTLLGDSGWSGNRIMNTLSLEKSHFLSSTPDEQVEMIKVLIEDAVLNQAKQPKAA